MTPRRRRILERAVSVVLSALLTWLVLLVVGCERRDEPVSGKMETAPSTFRLESEREGFFPWRMRAFCDTAHGNLLYYVRDGDAGAVAVVPGGCK